MSQGEPSFDVTVLLTDCAPRDAQIVFDTLNAHFAAEPEPGHPGRTPLLENPTVWSATYDAHDRGGAARPAPLSGSVTADISGCPHPVRQLTKVLVDSFAVRDEGHVSGDQEVEVCLRLTSEPA